MPAGARFDFEKHEDLISDVPRRLEPAREFEDKIDVMRAFAEAEGKLDDAIKEEKAEPTQVLEMKSIDKETPAPVEVPAVELPENSIEAPLEATSVEPPEGHKIEINTAGESEPTPELAPEQTLHIETQTVPVAEETEKELIQQPPMVAEKSPELSQKTGLETRNFEQLPPVQSTEQIESLEGETEGKTEIDPETKVERDKLKEIYENYGKTIIDGWQKIVSGRFPNEEDKIVQGVADEIARISDRFNDEQRKKGKDNFDFYEPVLDVLKPLYNQVTIKDGSEGRIVIDFQPEASYDLGNKEELEKVVQEKLRQLIKINKEYDKQLKDFFERLAEKLDNWQGTEFIPAAA